MKATKDSDIYTLNFVLFVTFVLKVFPWLRRTPLRQRKSRKQTKALDVENGADALCFRFDNSLHSAADFHLPWIIYAQKVVKEKCGGAVQLNKPQR